MITVEEALQIINTNSEDFGTEEIELENSLNRTLREKIMTDRDFPPFDRVTMDGIAVNYSTWLSGKVRFEIEGIAPAGSPQITLKDPNKCLEVMTGAIMPGGADTVIPYEEISINNGIAEINTSSLNQGQNIHLKGSDRKQGETIIFPGINISPAEIGICATIGKSKIMVSRLPKTIIISSGDELVEIDEKPLAHQIRKSNIYQLKSVLTAFSAQVDTFHLKDDFQEIVSTLKRCLIDYDLIILSGGVSQGKFDFLPNALKEVGVNELFHKIRQRPGKPFWFGKKGKKTVFAFPGNPVSSFMCMHVYLRSWLEKSLQKKEIKKAYAVLTEDVVFKPDLTYFLEVQLNFNDSGQLSANPVKGNGSGDLANLTDADAFIELPRGKDIFKKGECYPIIPYKNSWY